METDDGGPLSIIARLPVIIGGVILALLAAGIAWLGIPALIFVILGKDEFEVSPGTAVSEGTSGSSSNKALR